MLHDFDAWASSLPSRDIPIQDACRRFEDLISRTTEAWKTANKKIERIWPDKRLPDFIHMFWLRETIHALLIRVETPCTVEDFHKFYMLARRVERLLRFSYQSEDLTHLIGLIDLSVKEGPLMELDEYERVKAGRMYEQFPVHRKQLESKTWAYRPTRWPRLDIEEYLQELRALFGPRSLSRNERDLLSRTIWHKDFKVRGRDNGRPKEIMRIFYQKFYSSLQTLSSEYQIPVPPLRVFERLDVSPMNQKGPKFDKLPMPEDYTFAKYLDDIQVRIVSFPLVRIDVISDPIPVEPNSNPKLNGSIVDEAATPESTDSSVSSSPQGRPGKVRHDEIIAAIRKEGRPLQTDELTRKLSLKSRGKLPANLAWMVHNQILVNYPEEGYWLADVPWQQAS